MYLNFKTLNKNLTVRINELNLSIITLANIRPHSI